MAAHQDKVAQTYALSLTELAEEKGILKEVSSDVDGIYELLSADTSLIDLLESPAVGQDNKLKALDTIFKGKLHEMTLNFIKVLVHHRRQEWLAAILRSYRDMAIHRAGFHKVELTYARELNADLKGRIVKAVEAKVDGKSIVEEKVDPALLGGMVIKIGDIRVDASVKRQLDRLKAGLLDQKLSPADFVSDAG